MKKDFDIGTKRIKSSTLKQHIKTSTSWVFLVDLSENLNIIILPLFKKQCFTLYNFMTNLLN